MNSLTVLNNVEERVVESVNTAGKAFNVLSKSFDVKGSAEYIQEFKQLSDRYFQIVEKDIHKGLMEFVDSMTEVAPFDHSSYANKNELDVSHNFTEVVLLHLADLENCFKDDSSISSSTVEKTTSPTTAGTKISSTTSPSSSSSSKV
eukprot:gene1464-1701_t